jgi:hypothetical protein
VEGRRYHVNKHVVQGLVALAGLASAVSVASAQAPTTAQVWDVQFVVDSAGPFAAGPSATAVGITMVARVGIRENTSQFGTANFGVARVGGNGTATSGFRMTFVDALSAGQGLSQGTLGRGNTATGPFADIPRTDTSGDPLAGAYFPFREGFSAGGLPNAGENENPFNGNFVTNAAGNPVFTALTLSRSRGWNTVPQPQGVATLDGAGNIVSGEYAPIYRFLYIPREDLTLQAVRQIAVTVQGATARYTFDVQGDNGLTSTTNYPLPTQTFTFTVPSPGAAALVSLAGLAALRRRRA